MIFFKKNNIFASTLFIAFFALITSNNAIFSMIEHGPELPNIFQYPKQLVPAGVQTDQFIVSEEEEKEREQKEKRLIFALAIKTYTKNNESDPIDIILHNAFKYLRLNDIRKIRLSGRQACAIMNEMIKQSTYSVIIGSPTKKFVVKTKDKQYFTVHIPDEKDTKNTNQLAVWGPQFIDDVTLNTEFIYVEIDRKKFSDAFLKKMLNACTKPNLCKNLHIIACCVLDILPHHTHVSDYINTLLEITYKNNDSNTPMFHFCFDNKNNYSIYEKTLETQLKNITFPTKPYRMQTNVKSISCKKVPSLKNFLTQPNTLEELNIKPSCDDTDLLLNYCCQTPQKNLKFLHICHDKTFENPKQPALIAKFFDNTIFPNIQTLSLESFLEDIDSLDPLIKNLSQITNNTITSLTLKWFIFSRSLLECFLTNIQNLKELVLKNCAIKKLEQKILNDNFTGTLKLEKIDVTWSCDIENERHSLFFSIDSLEHLCSLCPSLRDIYIDTLLLDTQTDFNQFLLFIKKLSDRVNSISFNILATDNFSEILENDRETFEGNLNNLSDYLKIRNFNVIINLDTENISDNPELCTPFSITITKNKNLKGFFMKNKFVLIIALTFFSNSSLFCMKQGQESFEQQSNSNRELSSVTTVLETFLHQDNEKEANKQALKPAQGCVQPNVFQPQVLFAHYNTQSRTFSFFQFFPELENIIRNNLASQASFLNNQQKPQNPNLLFALALQTHKDSNALEIILQNAFKYLPLDDIKAIRLSNKEACGIMNEMLKQSMHAVVIGSWLRNFPPKDSDRSFLLHFNKEIDAQKTEHQIQYIESMTLNTHLLFFEIHAQKFSKKHLEKLLALVTKPEKCNGLKSVQCIISRVGVTKTNVSGFINSLFKLTDLEKKKNEIDYSFTFVPDKYHNAYKKTLEKQLKNITFPKNPYSLSIKFENISTENLPSTKRFLTQPDTLKELNFDITNDSINTAIEISKKSQKRAGSANISFDENILSSKKGELLGNIFNNNLFPSLTKLTLKLKDDTQQTNSISMYLPQQENSAITEVTLSHGPVNQSFLIHLLKNFKNLKTLNTEWCSFYKLHETIPAENFRGTNTTLENILIQEAYFFNDSTKNGYFSIASLKMFLSRCPNTRNICIENIFLDSNNGNDEVYELFSYIKGLAEQAKYIYFKVSLTDLLKAIIQSDKNRFATKLNDLSTYFTSRNIACKIHANLDVIPDYFTIEIGKKP